MARMSKFLNNHIIIVCTVIVATSFVALLFVNTERFFNTVSSSSILEPEFNFNSKLQSLINSQKQSSATVREQLLQKLANEHIPIIMCGFYDLITGSKRLQKPNNIDEGRWLQQIWAELMEEMGIPSTLYMSIMELRYSWFTETKDTFESFQAKLEPSFVKATLERYINSNGNFTPTSVDKYKKALSCKLYRSFSRSASLLNYMGPTTSSTTQTPTNTTTQQLSTTATPTKVTQQPSTTTTQQPLTTATPTQQPSTTPTTQQPAVEEKAKTTEPIPLLKWVVPSNFTAMCLEKGNRFQCLLMSILFVIAIVCVIAVIVVSIAPLFNKQSQSQF